MATLTSTITESITLNGTDQGATNTLTVAGINEVSKRIVSVTTTESGLIGFGTASSTDLGKSYLGGQFVEANVRYIRITNLDSTNHITLTFKNENSNEYGIKLDKGESYFYNADLAGGVVDTMDSNQVEVGTFTDATCDFTGSGTTVTCDASAKIKVGQIVNATNVPNRTITAVNTPGAVTSFTMSGVANESATNRTGTFTGPALSDLVDIVAIADTASCNVEVFVAST
tara:strand:- start:272 stop:958 length:687 start_codon:yes stop_codon:yes gene_type:complete